MAPIGPLFRVQQRPRNSVLTAISLQQHQGQLTVGAELKFRVGTPTPCYPQAWRVTTTPLAPAASLPDLPMSAIPSTLWPGSVTLGSSDLDDQFGVDTPLGRAFAAIALARFASDRGWRLIAVNLGLPAHCASTGARHWHTIDKAGHWPTYVGAIARLFEQLHGDHPQSTTNGDESPPSPLPSKPKFGDSCPTRRGRTIAASARASGCSTPAVNCSSRRHRCTSGARPTTPRRPT